MNTIAAVRLLAGVRYKLCRLLVWLYLCWFSCVVQADPTVPDYEREKRWADQTLATLFIGEPVLLKQKNDHEFLGLYTGATAPRGAVIVAHGRGWSPDFELYGTLRTDIAGQGYSTLSIQMPVLPGSSKVGDYLPLFPDSDERLKLAVEWLKRRGYQQVAIVSHSIGATMANHYLIYHRVDAWVFISIINGLEDMFRIKIPVLDVFGSLDWDITRHGGDERLRQILKVTGAQQVIIAQAEHFFEGFEDQLVGSIIGFLDNAFGGR